MFSILLFFLAQAPSVEREAKPAPPSPSQAPVEPVARPHLKGALEASWVTFPSGTPGGAQDLFLYVTPVLGFDGGPDVGLELGAELRLRVFDDPPAQRAQDYGQLLRREDWDQPSDFGQLVRELRVGRPAGTASVTLGPALGFSLGRGHLISRYSNRENPDYHPASAIGHLELGATRTELFASDVLGGRIFAGALTADMGRIIGSDPAVFDRYLLSFSLAHDHGLAGYRAEPATLLHLDFDAALYRGDQVQLFAFTGVGSRILTPLADLGAELGMSIDGQPGELEVSGKLELRKQAGGFRQGFFGPTYELSRFSDVGLNGPGLSAQGLVDGYSVYGELSLTSGPELASEAKLARVSMSLAVEHFNWGRTDADLALALRLLQDRALATVRASVVGAGVAPRFGLSAELRYRIFPALYLAGTGGTVYFPQPDGSLVAGLYGGLGLGADFER